MDVGISNRKVLVTGGTGSIGHEIVALFSRNGGNVVFQYDTNDAEAKLLEGTYGARGIRLDFLRDDLTTVTCEYDILVNCAGINISKVLTDAVSQDEWDSTIRVNLTTPFILTKKCLPFMMRNRWGRIINISSIYGLRVSSKNLSYNVSKHGLSALTKTVAREYGAYGITCNEICPAAVKSKMMQDIAERKSRELGISVEEYFRSVAEPIPAKRLALPQDIAQLALFLASEFASFINGVSIATDGGLLT
jgi:3-hydroxybutyrate dehydrogenase